jgi:ADP-heptose:LPS heptosyltransferase
MPDYKWPEDYNRWWYAPVRWIGAIAFVLGHVLGRACARWQDRRRGAVKRILVIRTDGLGDGVLFEPALRSLAARYPRHVLHLWVPAATRALLRTAPYVGQLLEIPRGCKAGNLLVCNSPPWRFVLGFALGRWEFELAVYPVESPEPLGNWLLACAQAAEKWAVDGDLENQFDWQRDSACAAATRLLSRRPEGGHQLLRNSHFAAEWGASIADQHPKLYPNDTALQIGYARERYWRSEVVRLNASAVVGVVPAGTVATNTYPAAKWAEVIRELWTKHRVLAGFIGSDAESHVIREIRAMLGTVPTLPRDQGLDVLALAVLLGRLDAVISIDTGPAHLAIAEKTPTVVLSGGGHPGRFFPWPHPSSGIVLNREMPCEGCLARCTLSEPECLTKIEPSEIVSACLDALGRRRPLRIAG